MPSVSFLVILLAFILGLGLVARWLRVPYTVVFVIGGLAISFIPGLPTRLRLNPNLIFFAFLPPLLYFQALQTSWRDFRFYLRPILLLAVGLVAANTIAVAYLAHWMVPDFPLAAGVALGAIISPPDAIAASAIAQRLALPRRLITILEGESLANDATSLVLFRVALGSLGVAHAQGGETWVPLEFTYVAGGGIVVGLAIGWVAARLLAYLQKAADELVLAASLLTPFVSYLLADRVIGVSGVLSVVATGLYLSWRTPEIMTFRSRLEAKSVWETVIYLLNGVVFFLIGCQLIGIVHDMREFWWPWPLVYALAINLLCVVLRFIWVFGGAYLPYFLSRSIRRREDFPDWRLVTIAGWSGMRGIVSLAAALTLNGLDVFPRPHLVQFITFSVIFFSLVVQGLTLPALIRWLGVRDDGIPGQEVRKARRHLAHELFHRLGQLRRSGKVDAPVLDHLESHFREHVPSLDEPTPEALALSRAQADVHRGLIDHQRRALLTLRRQRIIGDDVLRKIEHELDLEEARLRLHQEMARSDGLSAR
jgi:Na+/H+ antiporter